MRKYLIAAGLVLGALVSSASDCYAAGGFSVVDVGNFASVKQNGNDVGHDTKMGFGVGALVDFSGFEIGVLYAPRKLKTAQSVTLNSKMLNVPVLYRHYFGRFFSLGLGGFYDFNLNKDDANVATRAGSDYGAVGSVGVRVPLFGKTFLMLDGRYLWSLKDQGEGQKFREYQALAGLQVGY